MQIYRPDAGALPQKLTLTALELAILLISAVILFGPAGTWISGLFGWTVPAHFIARRAVIFGFSVIVFLRMLVTMFYLMRRGMGWSEAFTIPVAFSLYYIGFAVLVLPYDAPLGALDYVAMVLFVLGSYLNTGSELQRHFFKRKPENRGKLYTKGLFGLAMHINFFGDIVWIAAYALVTQNPWSVLIVLFALSFFAFYNVPQLDAHLADHYGDQFKAYAARTKKLVPFIW